MSAEILQALRACDLAVARVTAIYGFGSFFRGEPYNDIDILIVLRDDDPAPVSAYYEARRRLEHALRPFGVALDLNPVSETEFAAGPLVLMDELVRIHIE